jgi:hypothetical protein
MTGWLGADELCGMSKEGVVTECEVLAVKQKCQLRITFIRQCLNSLLCEYCRPKRDEVTGERRKLHNEELSDLYPLPNIVRAVTSRRMRWVGHVARRGEGRGVHRVLVGKP